VVQCRQYDFMCVSAAHALNWQSTFELRKQ
jgi:hypothetical protein